MCFEQVELHKIDLEDSRYRIPGNTGAEDLEQSINEFGLINPIQLIKDNGSYKVISGWKRLCALKKLKFKKIASNVFNRGELSVVSIYKLIYIDNKHRADDLLIAELISKISKESKLPESDLVNEILVFFGINPSVNNLKKYIAVSEVGSELKSSYLNDKLSIEQLFMLSEIENNDERRDLFTMFFNKFKFNNNESRDIIKDLMIIKHREKTSIKKIAELIYSNLKENANKNELRKEIKKLCYPKLTDVEYTYMESINNLKLPDNIKFVVHPYFESNDIELRIKFKDSKELSNAVELMESNLKKGKIKDLLGVIREGK